MSVAIGEPDRVFYLQKDELNSFDDVRIVSEDGQVFYSSR